MYDIPTVAICPAAWMDTNKALAVGVSEEALKYSLGYIDNWSGMQLNNITNAKNDFLNFYYSKNFSSLLDYYKAISIDLTTVNSSAQYENATAAVKLGDNQSYLIGKIFISFDICYAYAFSPNDRSLYTTTSASIKFYDKTNDIVTILPGVWLQVLTNINFQCAQIPAIYLPSFTNNKILISARKFATLKKKMHLAKRWEKSKKVIQRLRARLIVKTRNTKN